MCGVGTQARTRSIKTTALLDGHCDVMGHQEQRECVLADCSKIPHSTVYYVGCTSIVFRVWTLACKMSEWSAWSLCSRTCGGGERQRERFCENGSDVCTCAGSPVEVEACAVEPCTGKKYCLYASNAKFPPCWYGWRCKIVWQMIMTSCALFLYYLQQERIQPVQEIKYWGNIARRHVALVKI